MYSFTSAQDGDPLQDDVRLCLGDDLKKAQDHRVTSLRGRIVRLKKILMRVEYPQELFSSVDLLSLQFLGASCTQRKVSMVSFGGKILTGLSSILLVVVIIVTVVIVVVILVVVIFAIVEVVIVVVVFGVVVVVVDGVSLIF
ncbi:hypothetical protein Tco_0093125 [Tanacetum coccineum]